MTKEEVYKSIIDAQKKTGQGLSGIVRIKSTHFDKYIPELIEEGLVIGCDTGGTLGHPESNIFYMPTKGYNVWLDNDGNGKFKGDNLHKVRFYLGCFPFEDREPLEDEQEELKRKYLNPTMFDYIRDVQWMEEYQKWLSINKDELEVMRNLDDYYESPIIEFVESEIEYITKRSWYKDNKTIGKCLDLSIKFVNKQKKLMSVTNQLIYLYSQDKNKYGEDLENAKEEITKCENLINARKKLHRWFDSQDINGNIQELFENCLSDHT